MRPNILWILTTQWRAQAFGHSGDPNARTPFLDAFAAAAVRFPAAVTPHPFGPFARAAVLTGVQSPENGVAGYFDPLPAGATTIAHRLSERGYATAFFGKWHLSERDRGAPLTGEAHARTVVPEGRRGGFGFWEGFESGFLLNNPWLHGTRLPLPVRFDGYQSDVLCERALGYLRGCPAPWFAVVSLEAPHPPYAEPAAGVAPRDPESLRLRANVPEPAAARARRELSGYYAHAEATDRSVGRLLAGLPPGTIPVFTSVHGDMHGSHGLFRKGWPHEESLRVPLIIGGAAAPGLAGSPLSITELHGLAQRWADGEGAAAPVRPFARVSMPSVVALPDQCDRAWTGIVTARGKLVLGGDGLPWLHYDLARDPLELENLASDPGRAGERAELAACLTP
jgi:arylsulfatase A-like enzyme